MRKITRSIEPRRVGDYNSLNEITKVRVPVDDNVMILPNRWQDWVTVFGYLAFAIFIAWRVLTPR